jgi:hypothetical protein
MYSNNLNLINTAGYRNLCYPYSWMMEVKGIRHRGGEPTYAAGCMFTTVQFSLRNEGSSEYIRVCEGRESLRPNF